MIKVITLDLDGVYFLNGHQNFKKNMEAVFGLSQEQIKSVYFTGGIMMNYKKGEISDQEFWSWAIQEWSIQATQEEILDILVSGYKINPAIKELVKQLQQHNIKIAACTNNFSARIKVLDNKFGFLKDFDIKVFSFEQGFLKPSREIFQKLIDESKVQPEEIFITDDSPEKLGPAKELGIKVLPYAYFGQMLDGLERLGVKLDRQAFKDSLISRVSGGGVVLNHDNKILLTKNFVGNWALPKGHVEEGDTLEQTAFREIEEETGLSQLQLITKIPGEVIREAYEVGDLKIEKYFIFKTDYRGQLMPQDDWHTQAEWFDFDQAIDKMAYNKQKEFLIKNENLILNP